jgi:hypothetical protein
MQYTVNLLKKTVKNGVLSLKHTDPHLRAVLVNNYAHLSQILEQEGIQILDDTPLTSGDDNTVRLLLMFYFGETLEKRFDTTMYNRIYYRAGQKGMTVKQYLRFLGFKVKEDLMPDIVKMKDNQGFSFRDIEAMTGIPKSSASRIYKKAKERKHDGESECGLPIEPGCNCEVFGRVNENKKEEDQ